MNNTLQERKEIATKMLLRLNKKEILNLMGYKDIKDAYKQHPKYKGKMPRKYLIRMFVKASVK